MDLTGLSEKEAELARRREYTEPFIFGGNESDIENLQKNVEKLGLNLTRGGWFFHLRADDDKGKTASILTSIPEILKKILPILYFLGKFGVDSGPPVNFHLIFGLFLLLFEWPGKYPRALLLLLLKPIFRTRLHVQYCAPSSDGEGCLTFL